MVVRNTSQERKKIYALQTQYCTHLMPQMNGQPSSQAQHPHAYPPPPSSASPATDTPYGSADIAVSTAAAALSQQQQQQQQQQTGVAANSVHVPTPNHAVTGGRKKRPPGAPGSRGVATLTPEQLLKKRENDRHAQRAIRERTRKTIENLESRIRDLESQQPYQDLQRALQERDIVLAENDELRRRLAAVGALVGTAAPSTAAANGGPGLNELAALTAQQSPLPPLPQSAPSYAGHSAMTGAATAGGSQQQQHLHPDLRSPTSTTHVPESRPTATMYQTGESKLRQWSPSPDDQSLAQHRSQQSNGFVSPHPMPQYRPPDSSHQTQQNGGRYGLSQMSREGKSQSPPLTRHAPQLYSRDDAPLYARLPNNVAPETPLDSLLLDLLARCQKDIAEGVPVSEIIGPDYPSLVAFKDPDSKSEHGLRHSLGSFFIDILSKFPDIAAIPEKIAVLHIMFLVMRWTICPCERCYLRLPEWQRPVPEQLQSPHEAWVDHLPWPCMRRLLSSGETAGTRIHFDDFFIPYTTTLSLNWPYPEEQVFMAANPSEGGDPKMSPVFEEHLMKLSNWSLGPAFERAHPDICDDTVRIDIRGSAISAAETRAV